MAHVSHRLSNAFQGALAGGGDPATSPLYVFGPFLKLIVVAGVAEVTFGASIWLVVFTVVMVSAMYRLVMRWVVDGSGGSGLTEEEFGSWAVKVNAGITFVEYTLTFLVSIAALVTFMADRAPSLNGSVAGLPLPDPRGRPDQRRRSARSSTAARRRPRARSAPPPLRCCCSSGR